MKRWKARWNDVRDMAQVWIEHESETIKDGPHAGRPKTKWIFYVPFMAQAEELATVLNRRDDSIRAYEVAMVEKRGEIERLHAVCETWKATDKKSNDLIEELRANLDEACSAIDSYGYRSDEYGGTETLTTCIHDLGKERAKLGADVAAYKIEREKLSNGLKQLGDRAEKAERERDRMVENSREAIEIGQRMDDRIRALEELLREVPIKRYPSGKQGWVFETAEWDIGDWYARRRAALSGESDDAELQRQADRVRTLEGLLERARRYLTNLKRILESLDTPTERMAKLDGLLGESDAALSGESGGAERSGPASDEVNGLPARGHAEPDGVPGMGRSSEPECICPNLRIGMRKLPQRNWNPDCPVHPDDPRPVHGEERDEKEGHDPVAWGKTEERDDD